MSYLTSGVSVGPYELVEMIGHTGMSEVWTARDRDGTVVALKTMASQAGDDPHLRARFLREGGEHMLLTHPCIVPILDFFEQDGDVYLAMQYIRGGSLEDRLQQLAGRPLPVDEAVNIARQILSALDYAHQRLIVHRDVKPSNILLDGERAFLSDFGIALALGRPRLTIVEQLIGTRCYMSPEQIQTPLQIDHLSDVYSFGCVLYEMVTGHEPYIIDETATATVQYSMLARRIYEPPTPPREWNAEIPPQLERIILTSLAVNPQDRFSGCGSFMRALEGFQSGKVTPPPAPPPKAPEEKKVTPAVVQPAKTNANAAVLSVFMVGLFWIILGALYDNRLVIVFTIFPLLANFPLLWIAHRAWAALPASIPTMTRRQVWPMLIPIYNLYWAWKAFPGFARAYNACLKNLAASEPPVSFAFYNTFVLLAFYLPIPILFLRDRLIAYVLVLQMLVLFPIMARKLTVAVQRLSVVSSRYIATSQIGQVTA